MNNIILEKQGANFYGFENVDFFGKHHYHFAVVRGRGDLFLDNQELYFKQWITKKEYHIPIEKITKVETKIWHNMKMKWPNKVLRVYYQDQEDTKIFGVALGGKSSFAKGLHDEVYMWKKEIELLLKK